MPGSELVSSTLVHSLLEGKGARVQGHSIETLLTDEPSLRFLLDATHDRMRAMEDAVQLFQRIPFEGPLHLLVDYDVLRNFIEVEDLAPWRANEVVRFFNHSRLPYAIPSGALHELMEHVVWLLGLKHKPLASQEAWIDPLGYLARILEVDRSDLTQAGLSPELEERFERSEMRLSRLVQVLTDSRFDPKANLEHHLDDEERAYDILRSARRDREKNNRRDAVNLAIVLHRLHKNVEIRRANQEPLPHYVLLTSTSAVIRAASELRERSLGYWLVATPQQILIPDVLGLGRRRRASLSIARSVGKTLFSLSSSLSDQLTSIGRTSFEGEDAARSQRIHQHVKDIRVAVSSFTGEFVQLEQERETALSVKLAHERQLALPSNLAPMSSRFNAYIKLLDRLAEVFSNLAESEYEIRNMPPLPGAHFVEAQVNLKTDSPLFYGETGILFRMFGDHRRSSHEVPKPSIKLAGQCRGEAASSDHLKPNPGRSPGEYTHWTAQWQVTCDETRLLSALRERFTLPSQFWIPEECRESESIEVPVKPSSPLWKRGVIISTSKTTLGVPASHLTKKGTWDVLRLSRIQEMLIEHIPSKVKQARIPPLAGGLARVQDQLSESEPFEIYPEIQEIRLNSRWADIIFDIVPPEWSTFRRFSMISHWDLSADVAFFYDWLSTRLAAQRVLEGKCRELLRDVFPSYREQ